MHQGSASINWLAPSFKVMHKKGFSWYGKTIGLHQVVSLIHMYTLLVTYPLVKVSEDQLNLLRQTITRACSLCREIEKRTFPFVIAYILFPDDHMEIFSEQILTAANPILNNSVWKKGCLL